MSSAESFGQVACSSCNKVIRYPVSKAGLTAKCPNCGHRLALPSPKPTNATPKKPSNLVPVSTAAACKEEPIETPVVRSEIVEANARTVARPVIAPVQEQPSELSRFMADGQNPAAIFKLSERVKQICTSAEEVLYMAVQQKPIANLAPDAIVLTSRRAIIFRQKILGTMEFTDVLWQNVSNIHVKENLIGAVISITAMNGHSESVDYLPKDQASKVYRYGQEMEEKMIEWRRQRKMEEERNAADQVVVNTAVANPAVIPAEADDPVQRLAKLKAMRDAGLIDQSEFDAAKARILSSI